GGLGPARPPPRRAALPRLQDLLLQGDAVLRPRRAGGPSLRPAAAVPDVGPGRPEPLPRHARLSRPLDDHAAAVAHHDALAGAGAPEQRLRPAPGGTVRRAPPPRGGARH